MCMEGHIYQKYKFRGGLKSRKLDLDWIGNFPSIGAKSQHFLFVSQSCVAKWWSNSKRKILILIRRRGSGFYRDKLRRV